MTDTEWHEHALRSRAQFYRRFAEHLHDVAEHSERDGNITVALAHRQHATDLIRRAESIESETP